MKPIERNSTAYLLLTATMFLWAAGFVIARGMHTAAPPVGLSFWRWITTSAIIFPFALPHLAANWPLVKRHLGMLTVQGSCIIGGGTLLFIALNFTPTINMTIVNASQPSITVILAWLVIRERISVTQFWGIAAALIGVLTMMFRADLAALLGFNFNIGDVLTVLGTIVYAFYAVRVNRVPREIANVVVLFVVTVSGTVLLLPVYIAETIFIRPVTPDFATIAAVLAMAVFSSSLALLFWNLGIRKVGPNRAAIFVNLLPVFSAILAIIFLGEKLFLFHLIGAFLIFIGIYLVVREKIAAS